MAARLRSIVLSDTAGPEVDRGILIRILVYAMIVKLALALLLPLGIDESYAISVAREYSLSFFDHPPVSFWLPVLVADITGVEHAMIYRLPFMLGGVATTVMMYQIGVAAGSSRAGVWAAFFYAFAPFYMVSGGIFTVPDGPLNLASAVAVYWLVRIAAIEGKAPLTWWLFTGLALAFALGSKYQAAWIPLAVLAFMILSPKGRGWFLQPGPWLGGLVGLLGLLPVLVWNMQHDWASFAFHSARAGGGINPGNLTVMLVEQILYLLPPTIIIASLGLWHAVWRRHDSTIFLLALIALGPILIFNYVYLTSGLTFAHWTMPGWQFTLPLAGFYLAEAVHRVQRRVFIWTRRILLVLWVLVMVLGVHANTGILTRSLYDAPPRWDQTLFMFDFHDLGPVLDARGLEAGVDAYMASSWTFAGLLDTALGSAKPMQSYFVESAHHYSYLSDAKVRGKILYMEPAYLWDSARADAMILKRAQALDPAAQLLPPIVLKRGPQPFIAVTLVLLNKL